MPEATDGDENEEEVEDEWAGWEDEEAAELGGVDGAAAGAPTGTSQSEQRTAGAESTGMEEDEWETPAFQLTWDFPWQSASSEAGAAPGDGVCSVIDESRSAKAVERDAAIRLILARRSRTLRAAMGLEAGMEDDAEVKKRALKLLRLLHPDFTINHPLKGTKKHMRIEAAFKKLSCLRDASE